jgi:beta-glucosidase
VKNWITINEPLQTAVNGYVTGIFAPGRCEHALEEPYLVAHHQLLAHAEAVSVYRNKYQDMQKGQIGLVVDCEWAEPLSDNIEDKKAAARRIDFQLGWYLDPIFYGDYPETMRERLGDKLPKFSEKNKELLRTSLDFIGLNHYTSRFIAHSTNNDENYFYRIQEIERIAEWEGGEVIGEKAASPWLYVVPWGLRKVLNHVAQRYNNPPIYVAENGMDDDDNGSCPLHEMLDDKLRVSYYKGYLMAVAQAIKDGTDVRGYFAWSSLDNFEWAFGYTKRFGLIYVDYNNGLSRHLKSSAYWFLRFLKCGEDKNGKEE